MFFVMDISKYDEAIQKAINNFANEIERIKIKRTQKDNHLKTTLQNIQKDLVLLKNVINK